jgi:hypothetical protein
MADGEALLFWLNCQKTVLATVLMGAVSAGFCFLSIKVA